MPDCSRRENRLSGRRIDLYLVLVMSFRQDCDSCSVESVVLRTAFYFVGFYYLLFFNFISVFIHTDKVNLTKTSRFLRHIQM